MQNSRMSPSDFAAEFENLTNNTPFEWQKRLFNEWFGIGNLPTALDVPTGLGKTAVIPIWLLARAAGADLPRRLVYVVDRRVVVDQATKVAEKLRKNLSEPMALSIGLARGSSNLPISTLRGGYADNRDWLDNPITPAIVIGTVDMVGSRLLFEGYGVSDRMRPYHAGFLGVDSLIVLDEGHLCPAFEALLRQISNNRDTTLAGGVSQDQITPPFHVLTLSATGYDSNQDSSVFRLQDSDSEDKEVNRRTSASKRLQITEVAEKQVQLAAMAERAHELVSDEVPVRVVVFCDSRNDSLKIKKMIDQKSRKERTQYGNSDATSELLVGERRVIERSNLERWLVEAGFLDNADDRSVGSSILIATSAGEVGVDLDADHMICDLVSYERMVQRLGRVNRQGNRDGSFVSIYALRPSTKGNLKSTESEFDEFKRQRRALEMLPIGSHGFHEASVNALRRLKEEHADVVSSATSSKPLYPILTRPLLDAWSMTSFVVHEGRAEVNPWLRGWEQEDVPQTVVVWRTYLPTVTTEEGIDIDRKMVREFFQAAPVGLVEYLEAESSHVADWLVKRTRRIEKRPSDCASPFQRREIVAIAINRQNEYVTKVTFDQLERYSQPANRMTPSTKRERMLFFEAIRGSVLVVDQRFAGMLDGMLDESCNDLPLTADDRASWHKATRESRDSLESINFRVERFKINEDTDEFDVPSTDPNWHLMHIVETGFDSLRVAVEGLAIFTKPCKPTNEASRSLLSQPQSLDDHASQTASIAKEFATQLNLPDNEIHAIEYAARWHDNGKASLRWQNAMNAPVNGRPYAKTKGGGNVHSLDGYRHEFGSLLQAEQEDLPEGIRDLVLHLIVAHHGNARPTISSRGCDVGPPSILNTSAGEVAIRFVRLQRVYGHWGLAWREAILRAADQIASRNWEESAKLEPR